MIAVATSNGVYLVDIENDKILIKLAVERSLEIFGICWSEYLGKPIFASRDRSWLYPLKKKSTSCKIYAISNQPDYLPVLVGIVRNVHDVHQIEATGSYIFLTDTGRNTIVVYSIEKGETVSHIDIGGDRDDINHINALAIQNGFLLIGLNNRGYKNAQILKIRLDRIDYTKRKQRGDLIGEFLELPGREHTHDIFPFNDDYLVSASHDGVVFKAIQNEDCIVGGGWVRGLTDTDLYLWVGESKKAERSKRHSSELSGAINKYSKVNFEKLASIALPGAGQVNDLLYIDNSKLIKKVS
jgi:hypothetical protein